MLALEILFVLFTILSFLLFLLFFFSEIYYFVKHKKAEKRPEFNRIKIIPGFVTVIDMLFSGAILACFFAREYEMQANSINWNDKPCFRGMASGLFVGCVLGAIYYLLFKKPFLYHLYPKERKENEKAKQVDRCEGFFYAPFIMGFMALGTFIGLMISGF